MQVTVRIFPQNKSILCFDLKKVEYKEETDTLFFRLGHVRYAKGKGIKLCQKLPQASQYLWLIILK